ncbi:ArnT family glycosyltransferase [Thiosulfativibrio zosterae]|uniref:Glycosyltransferase RgtA/B/C/D-like domain-containing protein n=1 Tax=Thiosulfativibrio zosterae TaxID=2675053 RepID=A0A6F8PKZ9_9GAMM|nr:glycosyltransferase family 39 protein [Thiosulfativibrio zosterae]BBP42783.1 hypothetical protein THMIRHAT_05290 [Thiosulfativibrio zosterae]
MNLPTFNSPSKMSFLLIAVIAIWHLIIVGSVNLSVDEAHYALYGLHLDWSYFDHPPMVGWLNALILPFTQSDLGLRILPIILFSGSLWMLYLIANRLFPEFAWTGFWTIALINSAIMFQLLSLSMLPDTPIMLASLLVFWTLLNLRETQHPPLKPWLWLGFWLGIAGLSKYTAVTLVISLLLVMLIERRFYWLKQPGLYGAIALAGMMILPVLIWNAQHDWISFLYQIHHGTHNSDWSWLRAVQTQAAQFGVYSPLLFIVGWWLAFKLWLNSDSSRLLAIFALPTLMLFAMGSGYEMSLPHWTQLAWLFLAPAVVFWVWQSWSKRFVRWFTYGSSALTIIASLLLNSHLFTPCLPFPDNQDLTRELQGWPEAIAKAQSYQAQDPNTVLVANNWSQASRIAWYARPHPIYVTDNRFDQFDLWFGNPPAHSNGIIIIPSYEAKQPRVGGPGAFKHCQLLETLPIVNHQKTLVTYRLFSCQDFVPPIYDGWVSELPLVKAIQ